MGVGGGGGGIRREGCPICLYEPLYAYTNPYMPIRTAIIRNIVFFKKISLITLSFLLILLLSNTSPIHPTTERGITHLKHVTSPI